MVLDLDLNDPPVVENAFMNSDSISVSPDSVQASWLGLSQIQATIDIEDIEDEVVICSPRSFAEARDRSRRNHGVIVLLDEETESQREHSVGITARLSPSSNRRRRAPAKQTGSNNLCINLESCEKTMNANLVMHQELPKLKAPTFNCPVCMDPIVEETSTKCGHIFCKKCINSAIAAQSKCPTCRRKLKVKDTFRVYLPIRD